MNAFVFRLRTLRLPKDDTDWIREKSVESFSFLSLRSNVCKVVLFSGQSNKGSAPL